MIKTSVIIPVYNTAGYLEECIDSVFRQTQKEIEVIAINDGSTDDSWEILQQLKKKYPSLQLINQENHGLGYTRNVGIDCARGECIYFLDSDDYIDENLLETCYGYVHQNSLDLVMLDAVAFEDSGNQQLMKSSPYDRHDIIVERGEIFDGVGFMEKYYLKSYVVSAWLVFCSLDFLKTNRVKFMPRVYFEDMEFYCRIMSLAERIMYIPQMLYHRRYRNGSIMKTPFDLRKGKDLLEVVNAITMLQTLNKGKGWHIVRLDNKRRLLSLARRCEENGLFAQDKELSKQIFEAGLRLCGDEITNDKSLPDINFMDNVCGFLPQNGLSSERAWIGSKRKEIMTSLFGQLPLNQKNINIAIYGMGNYTETLLNLYEKYIGSIDADIIFLDTYVNASKQKTFRGYPVYNVKNFPKDGVQTLLISSPKYESEMEEIILKLYGESFHIIKVVGDLKIEF